MRFPRPSLAPLLSLVCAAAVTHAGTARAQERGCAGVGLSVAKPAVVEWTWWLGVGGGLGDLRGDDDPDLALRAGAALDLSIARLGDPHGYGGQVEVRAGPWLGAETLLDTHFVEGGTTIDLGQTYHAQWGTFGLRLGAGGALREDSWSPAGSVTLTWGVRSVLARYRDGGACVGRDGELWGVDTGPPPDAFALASGIRLFATGRLTTDGYATLIFGIEIEPTFLFPPYSLSRFGGSRPS